VLNGVKRMNLVRDRVGAIKISEKVSFIGPYKLEGIFEEALGGKEVEKKYFSRVLDKGKVSCYFMCI
jgi:hypothetical protein